MRHPHVCVIIVIATAVRSLLAFSPNHHPPHPYSFALFDVNNDAAALQKTAAQLESLQKLHPRSQTENQEDALHRQYMLQSANSLKEELSSRGLPNKGRKPDLAQRLVDSDLQKPPPLIDPQDVVIPNLSQNSENTTPISRFSGLKVSHAAGMALAQADFVNPSPIQAAAVPLLARGESAILHAETGSGKTLAYLLPITEQLWQTKNDEDEGYHVILTPTRELAAQVAGIASVLAPPGSVRLVSHPTNLLSNPNKNRGEDPELGGRYEEEDRDGPPRLVVGSAKSIMVSLYGNEKLPAPPTSKPEATSFMKNTKTIILDEVDRLLRIKKTRADSKRLHEKPAAIVTSAVMRLTLGKCQVICASATVGRPLRREVARILGLPAQACPQVVRGKETTRDESQDERDLTTSRAVTIPSSVENYVHSVDGSTVGKLLTSAFYVIKSLPKRSSRRILLVLTRGCGVNTQNAIGALQHFGCEPAPRSLLDALEADGTENMIQIHRQVSGATGVGESYFNGQSSADDTANDNDSPGYLLVTGEDTVRGLHLDGLDMVIVVGRPNGPDEYTHIAGRTGRAGRQGKVVTVVSEDNAAALRSWERMLNVNFEPLNMEKVATCFE